MGLRASTVSTSRTASPIRALGRAAVGLPIIPRARVHHGLGGEQGDVVLIRKARGDGEHRIGIGGVERGAIDGRILRIAQRERVDQRLLGRRGAIAQGLRASERCQRRRERVGVHRAH